MPEAAVAPAPAAASSPAPATPAAAPSSAPASSAPVSAPETPSFGVGSGVTSHVDPNKFASKDAYSEALLAEQLAAVPATEEAPVETVEAVDTSVEPVEKQDETVQVAPETEEVKPAEVPAAEEDFQLEPETIVTPEALSQMVTDNPEFGKLLEADPRLKGQLYKTAREAAELKPYREIFPDLESAKSAVQSATTFNDVRNVFMQSTTKEGTIAALGKIAELSYERDENGDVVMENGQPVVGADYLGFEKNVVNIGIEKLKAPVQARFDANQYHVGVKTQEEAQAAYDADATRLAVLDELMGQVVEKPAEMEQLPPHLRQKAAELDRREKELAQKLHGEKEADRRKFEVGLQTEADTRIRDGINKIIANVEKQGGVVSPYLKNILPKAIGAKLIKKIQANPALQDQMFALQRLPIGDASRQRRLAAIDRAVQQYLPEVAREELREAGVQIANSSAAKRAKVDAQVDNTRKTEPLGSTRAVPGTSGKPMTTSDAFDRAQAEWQKANPNRTFDKIAREQIIPRILQLTTTPS